MMGFYTISMEVGKEPLEVDCPDELPRAGQVLIFTEQWKGPGDSPQYEPGDEVMLLRRTNDAPWGRLSSLGNWVAVTKYGRSVWSNIEWLMAQGRLTQDM